MGLDIGIMRVTYLERPHGIAYEFAWEMAVDASIDGYMHGEGNNWAPFSQHRVLRLLDRFASERTLDAQARTEIFEWVRSLPWDGWVDSLAFVPEDDEEPEDDDDRERVGGLIELHFNW